MEGQAKPTTMGLKVTPATSDNVMAKTILETNNHIRILLTMKESRLTPNHLVLSYVLQ